MSCGAPAPGRCLRRPTHNSQRRRRCRATQQSTVRPRHHTHRTVAYGLTGFKNYTLVEATKRFGKHGSDTIRGASPENDLRFVWRRGGIRADVVPRLRGSRTSRAQAKLEVPADNMYVMPQACIHNAHSHTRACAHTRVRAEMRKAKDVTDVRLQNYC